MAELVDAADLKSADGDVVGVQVPLPPSPQRPSGRLAVVLGALAALALITPAGSQAPGALSSADQRLAVELSRRYAGLKRRHLAEVPEISVSQWLGRPRGQSAVLVDVREPREQRVSMLPGAISLEEFERTRDRYRGALVVPYCTIGLRSGLVARQLQEQGFRVRNLAGSALAWAHAGLPFASGGRPSNRLHVYGAGWNLLPSGYTGVL